MVYRFAAKFFQRCGPCDVDERKRVLALPSFSLFLRHSFSLSLSFLTRFLAILSVCISLLFLSSSLINRECRSFKIYLRFTCSCVNATRNIADVHGRRSQVKNTHSATWSIDVSREKVDPRNADLQINMPQSLLTQLPVSQRRD